MLKRVWAIPVAFLTLSHPNVFADAKRNQDSILGTHLASARIFSGTRLDKGSNLQPVRASMIQAGAYSGYSGVGSTGKAALKGSLLGAGIGALPGAVLFVRSLGVPSGGLGFIGPRGTALILTAVGAGAGAAVGVVTGGVHRALRQGGLNQGGAFAASIGLGALLMPLGANVVSRLIIRESIPRVPIVTAVAVAMGAVIGLGSAWLSSRQEK